MEIEAKPNVSFMTTKDRELFPSQMPPNRFGNEVVPLRGAPHRGPGCYDNEEKTNFRYAIEHKMNSSMGYTLGARTAPRMPPDSVFMNNPSPTHYQTTTTDLKEFTEEYKPFSVGAERFPVFKRDIDQVPPGAGTYEHNIARNRQVQWHQSFGGAPVMLPTITLQSTISKNTDKLFSTKEEKKYYRKLAYLKLYWE